ncbi:MAG: hypothetical protein FWH26_02240 [Oscillospiraceae bacterium]|nr:hypothetical protein [Oscillospiraceae bacterium]
MSMPDIALTVIDPRTALASIIASIALQEAAVSHVLNAEGEKIQAVVGMTGATVGDLQDINRSVMETVDNVALLEDDLRSKLQTTLNVLFPLASFAIRFIDSFSGSPVNCQCAYCTLTNDTTGESDGIYARGDILPVTNLKPGSYTLHMLDACAGHAHNENVFDIYVDARGNVTFDGAAVTEGTPAVIELDEGAFMAAAQIQAAQEPAVTEPPAAPPPEPMPAPPEPTPEPPELPAQPLPAAAPPVTPKPDANRQYIVYTLTNSATGETTTFYEKEYSRILASLQPGSYTLHMFDVFTRRENELGIEVDADGNVMFKAPQL